MQALIDPTTTVQWLSSWVQNPDTAAAQKYLPVFSTLPNSARLCEVMADPFQVSPPLFWVPCADNVVADQWYYDTATSAAIKVPDPAPYPSPM